MVCLAKKRLFQQRGKAVEKRQNLRFLQHPGGDEQLTHANGHQRSVGFDDVFDVVFDIVFDIVDGIVFDVIDVRLFNVL